MRLELVKPLEPTPLGWESLGSRSSAGGAELHAWRHAKSGTLVISSVRMATLPRSGRFGAQYHVAVIGGDGEDVAPPTDEQVKRALCAFQMLGAEESFMGAHGERVFWLPLNPRERATGKAGES